MNWYKKSVNVCLTLVATIIMAGCAPKTQYTWGDYGQDLYSMYSGDSDNDATAIKLAAIIAKGETNGTVPPGIYAEYGYLLLSAGKNKEAITYFEKEKQHFPESTRFMDKMISTAKIGSKPSASNVEIKSQNIVISAL